MNRLAAFTILLTLSSCATPAASGARISSNVCMSREKFTEQFLDKFQERVVAKGVLRQGGGLTNMLFELTISKTGNFTLAITGDIEGQGLTTCIAGEGFGLKILGDAVPGKHKI